MVMKWTFVTNHALVLGFIAQQPNITARELSLAVGITERAIRKIIADLNTTQYISKKKEGRRVTYRVNPDLFLRHETQRHIPIRALLESLGWERPKQTQKS